jgi:hypothetical protein
MSRGPLSPAGISLDGSEVNRRTMESQLRRGLDENSPRFGDRPKSYRAAYLSSATSSDDEHSMQIKLQPSPAKTVSPSTPYRANLTRTTQYASPVSMFDGMAKELRREFEKVTGHRPSPPGHKQQPPSSAILADSPPRTTRKAFQDIANNRDRDSRPAYTSKPTRMQAFDSPLPAAKKRPEPASASRMDYHLPDVTGLTEGLASPERGGPHKKLPPPRKTVDLERQARSSTLALCFPSLTS